MAGSFADAYVQILPKMSDFGAALKRGLSGIKNVEVPISLKFDPGKIKSQLADITKAQEVSITATADDTKAKTILDALDDPRSSVITAVADAQKATSVLSGLEKPHESVVTAVSDVARATSDLSALAKPITPPVSPIPDITTATTELATLARPIEPTLTPLVDDSAARTALAALQRAINVPLTVTPDMGRARAEVESIGQALSVPVIGIPDFGRVRAELESLAKGITVPIDGAVNGGGQGSSASLNKKGGVGISGAAAAGGAAGSIGGPGGIAAGASLAAVIATFAAGADMAGELDQTMGRIAISLKKPGQPASDLKQQMLDLRNTFQALGADPAFGKLSTVDFANAADVLAKANIPLNELKELLPAVGSLSVASGIDAEKAAKLVSGFSNIFKVQTKDQIKLVDSLAASEKAGIGTIEDYGEAVNYVGSQYNTMADKTKPAIEKTQDLLGAFVFLDNQLNKRGSKAGTGYQSFLQDIAGGAGNAARNTIADLSDKLVKQNVIVDDGGDMFFKANGALRDLTEIQKNLQLSTADLNGLEKQRLLNTIFQTDSQQIANGLIDDTTGKLGESIKATRELGLAEEFRKNNAAGYKGALDGLQGTTESLMTSLGDLVKVPAEQFFRGLADFGGRLTPVLNGIKVDGLAGGMRALRKEFPLVDAASQFFETHLLPSITSVASFAKDRLVPAFRGVATFVKDYVGPALVEFGGFVRDYVGPAVKNVAEDVIPVLGKIGRFIRDDVFPALQSVGRFVRDDVFPALQKVGQWVQNSLIPGLKDAWHFLQDNVFPIVRDVAKFIGDVFKFLGDIGKFLGDVLQKIQDIGSAIGHWVTESVPAFFKGILTDLGSLTGKTWNVVVDAAGSAKDWIAGRLSDVKDLAGKGWKVLVDAGGAAKDWILGRTTDVKNLTKAGWRVAVAAGGEAKQWIVDRLTDVRKLTGTAWRVAVSAAGNALQWVKDVVGWLKQIVSKIVNITVNIPGMGALREAAGLIGKIGSGAKNVVTQNVGGKGTFVPAPATGKTSGRAEGGPVKANTPYIVGEEGPELFFPRVSGEIFTNTDSARLLQQAKQKSFDAAGIIAKVLVRTPGGVQGSPTDQTFATLASSFTPITEAVDQATTSIEDMGRGAVDFVDAVSASADDIVGTIGNFGDDLGGLIEESGGRLADNAEKEGQRLADNGKGIAQRLADNSKTAADRIIGIFDNADLELDPPLDNLVAGIDGAGTDAESFGDGLGDVVIDYIVPAAEDLVGAIGADSPLVGAVEDLGLGLGDLGTSAADAQADLDLVNSSGVTLAFSTLANVINLKLFPALDGFIAKLNAFDVSAINPGNPGDPGSAAAPSVIVAAPFAHDPITGGTQFDANGNPVPVTAATLPGQIAIGAAVAAGGAIGQPGVTAPGTIAVGAANAVSAGLFPNTPPPAPVGGVGGLVGGIGAAIGAMGGLIGGAAAALLSSAAGDAGLTAEIMSSAGAQLSQSAGLRDGQSLADRVAGAVREALAEAGMDRPNLTVQTNAPIEGWQLDMWAEIVADKVDQRMARGN